MPDAPMLPVKPPITRGVIFIFAEPQVAVTFSTMTISSFRLSQHCIVYFPKSLNVKVAKFKLSLTVLKA